MKYQFGNDLTSGDEIGKGDVVDFDQETHNIVSDLRAVGPVDDNLRSADKSGFKSSCAGCDEGCAAVAKKVESRVAQHRIVTNGAIRIVGDGRSAGYDGTILRETADGLGHNGKIAADLSHAAAGKESDYRAVAELMFGQKTVTGHKRGTQRVDLLNRRIADIVDREIMTGIELTLEGKDGEHAADIAADSPDAPLFPRPYFGRDIVKNRYAGGRSCLCDLKVERRIVDENETVGTAVKKRATGHRKIGKDLGEMAQHLAEAHKGHVAVVNDRTGCGCDCHPVAAEKRKAGVAVGLAQSFDQSGAMEIAGCFACYYEIVHSGKICNYFSERRSRKKF